jgi:transposase
MGAEGLGAQFPGLISSMGFDQCGETRGLRPRPRVAEACRWLVERSIRDMLWYGGRCSDAKTSGTCRDILKREPALFTFVRQEGVEPTNDIAERSLRHAVTWRKGSALISRILTVVTTLRQQGRHALDYVTAACDSALHDQRPASLLPHPASSRA